MNNNLRYEFEKKASLVPNYNRNSRDADLITDWANKYCEAFDKNDEYAKDIYISALMLKFWDNVPRMYEAVKQTGYEIEDCVSQLYKCISAAMEYRAWQDPTKNTTAKACINQLIASRGAPEIIYEYNRDNKKANVNTVSFDQPLSSDEDSSCYGDTIEDESADKSSEFAVKSLIQYYLDQDKVVEAIIMDTIAFNDCQKETKETKIGTDEDGNEYKYVVKHSEFWPYRCIQILSDLPEDFEDMFLDKYDVSTPILKAAVGSIRKSNNQKLYKFLAKTLEYAKSTYSLDWLPNGL